MLQAIGAWRVIHPDPPDEKPEDPSAWPARGERVWRTARGLEGDQKRDAIERAHQDFKRCVEYFAPLVERLPRRLDAVGRQLEDGELSVRVRLLDDAEDRAFVTGLVREITMSIIAAACAVYIALTAIMLYAASTK